MKYRSVYSCWLFDEVRAGRVVYALDKKLKNIVPINGMTADGLAAMMHSAAAEPTRYEFWFEEDEKDNEC